MKIKFLLIISFIAAASILTAPRFVRSQQQPQRQIETCSITQMQNKKPLPSATEMCACEQTNAPEKATYETGEFPFGLKTKVPVSSKRMGKKRIGVAAGAGAIEQTEHTALLGELAIPNTDDFSSPEVEGLQKQVLEYRARRLEAVERDWASFKRRRAFWRTPTTEAARKQQEKISLKYKQFQDLRDTSGWNQLTRFDWRERGLDVGQVMQQGICGSCWAFASVAVYQASWKLEQMRTGENILELIVPEYGSFHRQPSVQQLLNCLGKQKGDCRAGWHGSVFAYMVNSHVPHIPDRLVFNKFDKAAIEEYTGRLQSAPTRSKIARSSAAAFPSCRSKDRTPRRAS